jgi:hypothetical protein
MEALEVEGDLQVLLLEHHRDYLEELLLQDKVMRGAMGSITGYH